MREGVPVSKVVLEIVCEHCTYFVDLEREDLAKAVKEYRTTGDSREATEMVWHLSQPCSLSSTEDVDYGFIDDSNDPESSKESWEELASDFEE